MYEYGFCDELEKIAAGKGNILSKGLGYIRKKWSPHGSIRDINSKYVKKLGVGDFNTGDFNTGNFNTGDLIDSLYDNPDILNDYSLQLGETLRNRAIMSGIGAGVLGSGAAGTAALVKHKKNKKD